MRVQPMCSGGDPPPLMQTRVLPHANHAAPAARISLLQPPFLAALLRSVSILILIASMCSQGPFESLLRM